MENNIIIDKDLPLLICDADEVIFNFMDSFDEFLNVNNMYFSYETFKLNGNILQKKIIYLLVAMKFLELSLIFLSITP